MKQHKAFHSQGTLHRNLSCETPTPSGIADVGLQTLKRLDRLHTVRLGIISMTDGQESEYRQHRKGKMTSMNPIKYSQVVAAKVQPVRYRRYKKRKGV